MTATEPDVSVVMPVRDGGRLLARAIDSLRRQTHPGWELVVTDDGSADGTAAVLAAYARADPRIRPFRHDAPRGVSAARNTAARAARATTVAYLDHDDEYYPAYLAQVLRWRDRADVLVFGYDQVEDRPDHPNFGCVSGYDPRACWDRLPCENIVTPLGVAHRRGLYGRAGGFDEQLDFEEDADLWRRFARAGATFAFLAAKSGRYHVRPDSLSRSGSSRHPAQVP